ncbi:MAG: FkbM family methyltransferase [Bacteroidetes bacterium]|nr:FkbM family methyltransferase [Bacteroidota bacterium]
MYLREESLVEQLIDIIDKVNFDEADSSSIYTNGKKIKVDSVRLKELIEKEEIIDFLKMDIEGAETAVLKDCSESLKIVKNLFVEFHSFVNQRQDLDELLSVLTKSGFRYFIKPAADRKIPFVNRINKNNPAMDLQLNIYAYRM